LGHSSLLTSYSTHALQFSVAETEKFFAISCFRVAIFGAVVCFPHGEANAFRLRVTLGALQRSIWTSLLVIRNALSLNGIPAYGLILLGPLKMEWAKRVPSQGPNVWVNDS